MTSIFDEVDLALDDLNQVATAWNGLYASDDFCTRPAPSPPSASPHVQDVQESKKMKRDLKRITFQRQLHRLTTRDRIYKRGAHLDIRSFVDALRSMIPLPQHAMGLRRCVESFVIKLYGRRNIEKQTVQASQLSTVHRLVYQRLQKELENPAKYARVMAFSQLKDVTKRLLNFFVIQYSLIQRELSYYLDRTTYPYQIVGKINDPNDVDALRLLAEGRKLVWLNFHREYKNCRNQRGSLFAPYRRSVCVEGRPGELPWSLCQLNFFSWFDSVGGLDLFRMCEADLRVKKTLAEADQRLHELERLSGPSTNRRKRKVTIRTSDGANYHARVIATPIQTPFHLEVASAKRARPH